MKHYITIALFIAVTMQSISAQTFKTSTKAKQVTELFSQKGSVEWAIPVSKTEKLTLQWNERKTSFTEKEGIRTFVGYQNENLIAIISFLGNTVSGNVQNENGEIHLQTSSDGFLVLQQSNPEKRCGTCSDDSCHLAIPKPTSLRKKHKTEMFGRKAAKEAKKIIPDDNVVRMFRLALAISNDFYKNVLNSSMENVKTFWANTETGLNEIYMRDIGVKFQLIADEKLVITDPNSDLPKNGSVALSTKKINELIGEKNYDLGVFFINYVGASQGIAAGTFGYFTNDKAYAAVKVKDLSIIAHEIGHLLGAHHIHTSASASSKYSHKTETDYGQSIMGYGSPKDFFSLVTLSDIRADLFALPYYTDETKAHKVGEKTVPQAYDNFPIGIKTNNRAPKIDRTQLKEVYELPANTFFQFHIPATDPDNDPMLYAAHQVDKAVNRKSFAKFYTRKSSEDDRITFQEEYGSSGYLERSLNTSVNETYTFWLGVNDGKNAHLRDNHATRYDVFEAKVKITNAKPFKITKGNAYSYKKGERVVLKWDVDEKIFKNTKVRIWLSDDFGKTFKYLLEASTENDGECEVTLPQIEIGSIKYKENIKTVRAGVFKIEVINHIAYALSALDPLNSYKTDFTGGFLVLPSDITFTDVPKNLTLEEGQTIPEKYDVKASTKCSKGLKGSISFEEKETQTHNGKIISRTWTAEDYCGTKASYVQHIFINKKVEVPPAVEEETPPAGEATPPAGEATPPADEATPPADEATPPAGEATPPAGEATPPTGEATPPTGEATPPTDEATPPTDGKSIPTDEATPPTDGKSIPTDKKTIPTDEIIIYNAVSTESGSENYLKIENSDNFKDFQIEIFNELGQKVYESKNYQASGDTFRGYANVKGVVGKGKRLPSGTYFYILTYRDNRNTPLTKKGYLFVR